MATSEYTTESLGPLTKPGRVDRDGGYVYGVRIVNPESVHGRRYPGDVLSRDAVKYQNAAVGLGHRKPDDDLAPSDKFARVINPRPATDGSGGLEADLRFNPKHPFAEQFCWACEHDPSMYSLSQYALVKWRGEKDTAGRLVAESILNVASVDIVAKGGTTSTIFESATPPNPETNAVPTPPEKTPPTVADVIATITAPAALDTFLASLFSGLPSGVFTPDVKRAALTKLLATLDTAAPASESAALDWLREMGAPGRYVAESWGKSLDEKRKADDRTKALALCKEKGLADALATDTFVEQVAESLGNPTKAAALIEDRKGLTVPGTAPGASPPAPPRTTSPPPPPAGKKSVRQLAEELAAG